MSSLTISPVSDQKQVSQEVYLKFTFKSHGAKTPDEKIVKIYKDASQNYEEIQAWLKASKVELHKIEDLNLSALLSKFPHLTHLKITSSKNIDLREFEGSTLQDLQVFDSKNIQFSTNVQYIFRLNEAYLRGNPNINRVALGACYAWSRAAAFVAIVALAIFCKLPS